MERLDRLKKWVNEKRWKNVEDVTDYATEQVDEVFMKQDVKFDEDGNLIEKNNVMKAKGSGKVVMMDVWDNVKINFWTEVPSDSNKKEKVEVEPNFKKKVETKNYKCVIEVFWEDWKEYRIIDTEDKNTIKLSWKWWIDDETLEVDINPEEKVIKWNETLADWENIIFEYADKDDNKRLISITNKKAEFPKDITFNGKGNFGVGWFDWGDIETTM